jgi:hypothetical protein
LPATIDITAPRFVYHGATNKSSDPMIDLGSLSIGDIR